MSSITRQPVGHAYWRSLDELADSPDFRKFVESEFPSLAEHLLNSPTRRQFLKIMSASLAFAGLTGCRWPKEDIVPYAKNPAGRKPGVPLQYATTLDLAGFATGLLVTSYDGRPIKVEGNRDHPFSLGATDAIAQASILDLYDPDRSVWPVHRDGRRAENVRWDQVDAALRKQFGDVKTRQGVGLCVLSEASSSPSVADMRRRLLAAMPQARWFEYEPLSRDNERRGAELAFGQPLAMQFALDQADVIVCLDADLLLTHPASVRHTRDFARGRTAKEGRMSRLYAVESTLSLTGSNADGRYLARCTDIPRIACQLAAALIAQGLRLPSSAAALGEVVSAAAAQAPPKFVETIARDLLAHRERGIVAVGPRQPALVHALAHVLNEALGNQGRTVQLRPLADGPRPTHLEAIASLTDAMRGGAVDTLLILGGNPVYDAPADVAFGEALSRVRTSIHLSEREDETSLACTWHLPRAHYLESWGDARALDGTLSIVQPLIEPLYGGRTPIEILALAAGDSLTRGYDIIRRTFESQQAVADGEADAAWRRALHDGVVAGSTSGAAMPALKGADWAGELARLARPAPVVNGTFELVFAQDHKVYDGRFANNGWLQELPDPITKLTWDNAALMAPGDADRLGVRRDDLVDIALAGRTLRAAVCVVPGQAPGSLTLLLGYGRRAAGQVGERVGFDAYAIRTLEGFHAAAGATVKAVGASHRLATTQDHHAIRSHVGDVETQHRVPSLVREGTLEEFLHEPRFVRHMVHSLPLTQPFADHTYDGFRWGMAIDLSKCTGCSACVVACQAENNVPVVGKDEVIMGREMHWLRIDRYFRGDPVEPQVSHQPMPCQHCENAPCEQVCPVAATIHDSEGLNLMVYNRCVGTRYCSNNCPYKVRRFNWFYNHYGPSHPRSKAEGTLEPFNPDHPAFLPQRRMTEIEIMVHNPSVTVRSRGVMEKCTFCIQRIEAAKISARNESVSPSPTATGEPGIPDGAIVPACAQVCPAEAIVFGDLNDPASRVRAWHADDRAYDMLEELNARPRNRYLARLRNPASERGGAAPAGHGHDVKA
jgi:molybdopterin-containing oxidoreductase family iron-sulfur binding subunit